MSSLCQTYLKISLYFSVLSGLETTNVFFCAEKSKSKRMCSRGEVVQMSSSQANDDGQTE